MKQEIEKLLKDYFRWLQDKTAIETVVGNEQWVCITTPHLDRHNDYLQIYVSRENGGFLLTDDAYILNDLFSSGCNLDSPRRKELLEITLRGFGVQLNKENQLTVTASADDFPLKKHNLVQSMLAVNDMFYLAAPHVASLFYEDVIKWLELHEIRYTPRVSFVGKSGYTHNFHFVIPKFKDFPERLMQVLTHPKKDDAHALMFRWMDIKETRTEGTILYAVLNDTEYKVPGMVLDAFQKYDIIPVLWSDRERLSAQLAV